MSEIGEAWKRLSPAEKQPFEEAAAADLSIYRSQFDKYKASGKLEAWKRDPAKPKRPLTAFMAWAQEERRKPEIAKLSVAAAGKQLGAAWANVPAEQKASFESTFKVAKEKYDSELKAYKESGAEKEWLKRTGRLDIIEAAEAKKQAQKDKVKEARAKKLAKDAEAKEKKAEAKKAKAAKAKALKAKAAAAKAAKAEAAKAKAAKAKAAKAAKAKAAKDKAIKAKEAKAAKAKAAKEKKLKAREAKKEKPAAKES